MESVADTLRRLSREADFIHSELASLLYVDEVLAGDGSVLHVDTPGSVRGLIRAEQDLVQVPKIKILSAGDPHGS